MSPKMGESGGCCDCRYGYTPAFGFTGVIMTRLALLTAAALLSTPAFAASEGETNAQAIALCRAAIAEKAPASDAQFVRGDFKARVAHLKFRVRDESGVRRAAQCRVSNMNKAVTDLTIG
jgi:hypothetical protein